MKSMRTAALLSMAIFVFTAFGYAQIPQDMRGRDRGDGSDGGGRVNNPGVGGTGISHSNPGGDKSTTSIAPKELSINDKLAGTLKPLLPEGIDPRVASNGFQDLKDFVATVRAANNLKVPFN